MQDNITMIVFFLTILYALLSPEHYLPEFIKRRKENIFKLQNQKRKTLKLNFKMVDAYFLLGGAFGVGIGAGIISYFYSKERRLIKENKEARKDLITVMDKIKKKEEVSRLVNTLGNYLALKSDKKNYC
jgi:CRISPR/Cas system-associated exonuclease Cas4 (RecB family)